ncbi:hypothetical protein V0M98_26590 [Pseudomonas silesiensis]|uniref:hypothetical protein n=1 Tax=Pseudomonas silesiensis TaxID=1853130 RepID=UPI0030CCB3D9
MSDIVLAAIAVFILVFLFLATCWIYVSAYLYIELIENYLSRSKFVAISRGGGGSGLRGKAIRSCSIALMFLIPKLCERRGLIEKDELLRLPVHLKRKLLVPWVAGGISFFAMFVFWLLVV